MTTVTTHACPARCMRSTLTGLTNQTHNHFKCSFGDCKTSATDCQTTLDAVYRKPQQLASHSVWLSFDYMLIIQSVDIICRDSRYTIYDIQNLKPYGNVPFIFECFLPTAHLVASKKELKSPNDQNVFLLFSSSSSSSSHAQASSNCATLSQWFLHKKQQHLTPSSGPALCFSQLWSLMRWFKWVIMVHLWCYFQLVCTQST